MSPFFLFAVFLLAAGCGAPEPPSAKRFAESLVVDMQERAFDRMYQKLTAERRRELSAEEYVRYNTAAFEKLDGFGGFLDDWQVDDSASRTGTTDAEVAVRVHVVFSGRKGPSEHRRKLIFKLSKEADQWKFDSFRSYDEP